MSQLAGLGWGTAVTGRPTPPLTPRRGRADCRTAEVPVAHWRLSEWG